MTKLVMFLLILLVFTTLKWFARYVDCLTMFYVFAERGYAMPEDEELERCRDRVFANFWKHVFKKHQ